MSGIVVVMYGMIGLSAKKLRGDLYRNKQQMHVAHALYIFQVVFRPLKGSVKSRYPPNLFLCRLGAYTAVALEVEKIKFASTNFTAGTATFNGSMSVKYSNLTMVQFSSTWTSSGGQ